MILSIRVIIFVVVFIPLGCFGKKLFFIFGLFQALKVKINVNSVALQKYSIFGDLEYGART